MRLKKQFAPSPMSPFLALCLLFVAAHRANAADWALLVAGKPPITRAQCRTADLAAAALQDFFPLPGETANSEQWSNAFMLEGSQIPSPVNGKSTLWRKIEKPVASVSSVATTVTAVPDSDVYKRLDMLTKQLEALTQVHPMQSTAELFLFVAIGLIFLLAIDTLLRFATTLAVGRRMRGGGGRLLNRRWFK
jgi:hypothetical protein